MRAVTHNGPFHADDVLALALIRTYVDPDVEVARTRDPAVIAAADLVFDVGGEYDPARRRFDHHQAAYQGPMSSAGLVLAWLADSGRVDGETAAVLREQLVAYVDAVDTGARPPQRDVPCFAKLVDACNRGCRTFDDFDRGYQKAVGAAQLLVEGLAAGVVEDRRSREIVGAAMASAAREGRRVVLLEEGVRWKPAYFGLGGAAHPTDYVLMPSPDGTWQVHAIPPGECSFDQKRPLPDVWGGLTGEALSRVIGVSGARFAHKNRFIAVFDTREAAVEALSRWDRWP